MRRLPLFRLLALACATVATAPVFAADPLPAIASFFETPRIDMVTLSPKGGYVAMAVVLPDGTQGIVIRETADPSRAKMVTRVDPARMGLTAIHWVNEKRLGYTAKNVLKNAQTYLDEFAVDIDGESLRHLINGDWRHRNTPATGTMLASRTLTTDYDYYGQTADGSDDIVVEKAIWNNIDPTPESSRLYRLNTRTQRLSAAYDGAQPSNTKYWLTDNDAVPRIATSVIKGRCITSYRTPQATTWTEIDNGSCLQDVRFTPQFFDGADTLYVKAAHNGYAALYRYDLKTMQLAAEPLVATAGFDFTGYAETDTTIKRMVGLHLTTDARTTVWFNAALKADQEKIDAALPGSINTIACAADCLAAPVLLVRVDTDRRPTEYVLYTRATGAMVGLGSSHPDIKPEQMGERSFHRYTARDGRAIPAYVTMPVGAAAGPRPTVVLVHGGPHVRGSSWEWNDEAAFLASRGYVVIQPEFRGSAGFGSDHLQAGFKQWGGAMQDDLADAAQWAVKQGWADPKRIGIMGASYGGYATLMGLIKDPQIFRAGVAWAGVTDLDLMFTSAISDASAENLGYSMRTTIGDPDTDAELFRKNSPVHRAAELTQPLLLAHGADDRRVPLQQASRFFGAVKEGNPKTRLIVYDNEGHGWRRQDTRLAFWQEVESFLDTNLKQAK
jgi:dipeptidyl aminopeptidase/acylaminoacyl peptidase